MDYTQVSILCNELNITEWNNFVKGKKIADDNFIDAIIEKCFDSIKTLFANENVKILLIDANIFAINDSVVAPICSCGSSTVIVKVKSLEFADINNSVLIPCIDNFIENSLLKDLPQIRVPVNINKLDNYKWCCVDCATLEWNDFEFNINHGLMYINQKNS